MPEADAPQRRRRERVRKPVTAVLAEVISDAVAAITPEPRRGRGRGAAEAAPPPPEPAPDEAPERSEEGPKRRGWWSRALGS